MHRHVRAPARILNMSTTTSSLPWILNGLIETCKDGQEGFRNAAEHVKDQDYKSLFAELSNQRQLYIGELRVLLDSLDEGAAESGSVAGAIHRGWIGLKSLLTKGDEHAILEECERGEDAAVDQYREVLEHDDLPADVRELVDRQFMGIKAAHDRVRALRDRTEN
jgi:uncharacterized protein (TIGR02284 family)